MEPNIIINMETSWIIIAATVAIALCAIASFVLALSIQQRDKEYRQQTADLFQAIVISNILTNPNAVLGGTQLLDIIKGFDNLYKGKTPIYLTEKNKGK